MAEQQILRKGGKMNQIAGCLQFQKQFQKLK
jgi:hypothetical protein